MKKTFVLACVLALACAAFAGRPDLTAQTVRETVRDSYACSRCQ